MDDYTPKKSQAGMMLYRDALIMLALASDEVTAAVVKVAANYFLYGTESEGLDGLTLQIWQEVKHSIDTGTANYQKRCKDNHDRAAGYWRKQKESAAGMPAECQRGAAGMPILNPKSLTSNHKSQNDICASKPRAVRFTPPTEEAAAAYFIEKGSTAQEAQNFCDFYGSKGWTVGKSGMRDWKKAANGWIRRAGQFQQPARAAPATSSRGSWGQLCDGTEPQAEEIPVDELFPY